MIKVLIDGRTIRKNPSGVGYVVKNLVRELSCYSELAITVIVQKGVVDIGVNSPNLKIYATDFEYQFAGTKRFYFEQAILPRIISQIKPDIVHLTDSFGLPFYRSKKVKYIATVHDLIPMTKYRELMGRVGGFFYDVSIRQTIKSADKIVAVSKYTQRDICRHFPDITRSKVSHVYNGIEQTVPKIAPVKQQAILKKFGIDREYIFYLGGFAPRKNTVRLLEAFYTYKKTTNSKIRLVLAGRMSQKPDIVQTLAFLKKQVKKYGLDSEVIFLDYLNTHEKYTLLHNALFFAYISLYEGFGLPALEAFAADTPVLTSKDSPMQEVTKGLALYVDPQNVKEITEKLKYMTHNINNYKEKAVKGRQLINPTFSWDRAAKKYYQLYTKLT
ncbi:MAG: glycosyltransferase family 4 protein [Candidatus Paceibacterota bacterium]